MICSVGIDLHQGQHRARCLDDRAQPCDSFSFQTTPEGLSTLEERVFRDGANPVKARRKDWEMTTFRTNEAAKAPQPIEVMAISRIKSNSD